MITNNVRTVDVRRILADNGIRPTYQRLKILEYLAASEEHPTADMIYRGLVKHIPTMSKTTVYNTLKSFLDKGIVRPLMITGTEIRFDCLGDPHHHLLCEKCNRIMDIDISCPHAHKGTLAGHKIKELHGYFKGVCSDCLK